MVVGPGVEVKAVKGDTLRSDWNDGYLRTHVAVEPVLVHAEIRRCVSKPNEPSAADAGFDGAARTGFGIARGCTGRAWPTVGHVSAFASRVVDAVARYTPHRIRAVGTSADPRPGPDERCLSRGNPQG